MSKAVLLVAHGSRREEANSAIFTLLELVAKKQPEVRIAACFLQFVKPDLPEVITQLAEEGIEEITVVPIFLYEGVHILEDIPEILAIEARKWPRIRLVLAPVLGIDERMADIVWDRVHAAARE